MEKIIIYKEFDLGDFYSQLESSEIKEELVAKIEDWYFDLECKPFDNAVNCEEHTISDLIGFGSTARAYRLDAERSSAKYHDCVIKELFPSELGCQPDDKTRKIHPKIEVGADEYIMRARKKMNAKIKEFIEAARHSKLLENDASNLGISLVLKVDLVMTSIGLCQISPKLCGALLDEFVQESNADNSRKSMQKTLEYFVIFLKSILYVYHNSNTVKVKLNNGFWEYTPPSKLHADIKCENVWRWTIDGEETVTFRSLDFGSVIDIDDLINSITTDQSDEDTLIKKHKTRFESTESYYSKKLICETIKQVALLRGDKAEKALSQLLVKQLDLVAITKLLLAWLIGNPNVEASKISQEDIFNSTLRRLNLNEKSIASFKVYHIVHLFVCLLTKIHIIERCVASNFEKLETDNTPPMLLENILTGEELKQKIQNLIDILKDGEKCYIDNHTNLDDQFQKSILDAKGIYTMKDMFDNVMEDFNKELVHPGEILYKWAYN